MTHTDAINFDDLEPIKVPVSVKKVAYWLVEASADAAIKYRNASLGAAKLIDGKICSMEGMASVEPLVVSRCLYLAAPDGTLRIDANGNSDQQFLVSLDTILGWPNKVQATLYKRLREISPELVEKAETPTNPKESPSGTPSSSS